MAPEQAADLFAALGDPRRIQLVQRLARGTPLSATALTDGDVTRQAITRHLTVLHDAGIIHKERRGREVCYTLHDKRVDEARQFLDRISIQWDRAIERLRTHVESE